MKKENIILTTLPVIIIVFLAVFASTSNISLFTESKNSTIEKDIVSVQETKLEKENNYNDDLDKNIEIYENIYAEERTKFKIKIQDQWGEFKTSTNTQWVSYTDDGQVRRSVDYDNGTVSVELLKNSEAETSIEIRRKLEKEVFTLLNFTESDAFYADEVAQNVEARLNINEKMIQRGTPTDKRLFSIEDLTSVTYNYTGIVKTSNKYANRVKNDIFKAKISNKKIFRSSFKIEKSVLQKAIQYAENVGLSSHKEEIPTALIFAIIESESSFNPMAKSHIPAYGLMQIVPRSAGRDATKHLYGKAKILAPSFLYSTENNINVGSAYLHVLYYKYLRKIKDPKSRIYCTIAAYNTGASNVARAFIRKKNIGMAVKQINKLTPDEVYETLVKHLPFRETRRYVKKVSTKMQKYL